MINVYTEGEAKEKICHRDNDNCIGSDCMAWRYMENLLDPDTLKKVLKYGYCGLAGKPE